MVFFFILLCVILICHNHEFVSIFNRFFISLFRLNCARYWRLIQIIRYLWITQMINLCVRNRVQSTVVQTRAAFQVFFIGCGIGFISIIKTGEPPPLCMSLQCVREHWFKNFVAQIYIFGLPGLTIFNRLATQRHGQEWITMKVIVMHLFCWQIKPVCRLHTVSQ